MDHPIEMTGLSPQAARIVEAGAPAPAKMMAASGLAPLQPKELVSVLYVLSYDRDAGISAKAQGTLRDLPEQVLLGTLSAPLEAAVLDGVARLLLGRADAVERIVLNRATGDETIVWLAEKLRSEKLLEMICANEQRLLRCPAIIEKLYLNRHARMSSVERAIELAVRNGIDLSGIPAFEEAKKAIEGQLIFEAEDEPTPDDLMFMGEMDRVEDVEVTEEEVDAINNVLDFLSGNTEGLEDTPIDDDAREQAGNLQLSLAKMTISQKIRTAMLGNSTQRSVLVRDANKLVIMAVLKSPAINDAEVRRYANLKSLPEEAIRYIAAKRDWTKHYAVKCSLVSNPRTPIEYSLRFLNHLRPNDVRTLERSKDVPAVIKKAAVELRRKRSS